MLAQQESDVEEKRRWVLDGQYTGQTALSLVGLGMTAMTVLMGGRGRSATVARVCYFARRWVARDRAWRWRCAKTGEPFVSLRGRAMDQNLEPRR